MSWARSDQMVTKADFTARAAAQPCLRPKIPVTVGRVETRGSDTHPIVGACDEVVASANNMCKSPVR